jgi:Lar family restriction alleviation protein
MEEKIKPCPFCGDAELDPDPLFYVSCKDCSARGEWFNYSDPDPKREAIKAWNTRTIYYE